MIVVIMQKRLLVKPDVGKGSKSKDSSGQADGEKADNSSKSHEAQQKSEAELVDLRDLNRAQRQQIVDNALATNEQSNEVLLDNYAQRADKCVRHIATL